MLALALLFVPSSAQEVLPVERVRFYETGVAWFERSGEVRDATRLPVPTSHLDDALKSLVVLGGDVDVGAITFSSAVGEDAARVSAGLDGNDRVAFEEALRALLGAEVSVQTGRRTVRGALLDVERLPASPPPKEGPAPSTRTEFALTLLDSEGSIHRADTTDLVRITSEEQGLATRLDSAARTLAKTRAQREASLGLQLETGGELALGYLAEAPVWRVSYRVLQGADDAQLQAWALIHNDTDEPWEQVRVELANGEPDSFLFPLAAPRYLAREMKTPDQWMSTVPQLAAETPDGMWTSSMTTSFGSGGLGSHGTGYGGGSSRESMMGSTSTLGAIQLKEAEPVQTPTQFIYRAARPLDLPAHHSALVPLVHQAISSEPGVIYTPGSTHARNGLWLTNDTERTLPEGVVSVVEAGGLAGEAELERLKPEETQMLLIGNELDVDLVRSRSSDEAKWTSFRYRNRRVELGSVTRTQQNLSFRNRSGRSRATWVALRLGPNEQVEGGVRTEIDPHHGWTWAVLDVAAGEATQSVAWNARSRWNRAPEELSADQYRSLAESEVGPSDRLLAAADQIERIEEARAAVAELQAQKKRAEDQLDGLRSDLEAAAGGEGTTALGRRAGSVETEIRRLEDRKAAGNERIDELVEELHAVFAIEDLALADR